MATEHLLPPAFALLLGAVLLVAGRRLFWVLVGAAGFLLGMRLGLQILGPEPEWMRWLFAAVAGLIGLALAKLFQKVAVGMAGFFLAGFAAMDLLQRDLATGGAETWVIFAIAGVLGAILAGWLFEIALVVFSSYLGAVLVIDALNLPETALMLGVLFAAGVLVQSSLGGTLRRAPAA
ncbi:MAG TPA: DUF4203 domain-containing protein [Thermoanaerobaculia bacterium]|nr:DUF4203 domain-containing protein [Thermoanaerobaculia bacterium]